ncbi:hypothetical protein M2263_000683 [Providencia alcalifaciens]|nr:hypothetical protein [Providencia alcalifaciens]
MVLEEIHSSNAISTLDNQIKVVEGNISKNNNKIKSTFEIDRDIARDIRKCTTKILPDNSVKNSDIHFRLSVSARASKHGVNLQSPEEIEGKIVNIQVDINKLSRKSELLTLIKLCNMLREVTNSGSYNNMTVEDKEQFRKEKSQKFETVFCKEIIEYFAASQEMTKLCEYKAIKPFTSDEIKKILPDNSYENITYTEMMDSVLKKVESKESKCSKLKNDLKEVQMEIDTNEIEAAKEYVSSSNDSTTAKKLIAILGKREDQIKASKDAPKKVEIAKNQLSALTEMKEVAVETKDNSQHLQLMDQVLLALRVGNKTGLEILQYNQDLQNEVETSRGEAFATQQEIDNMLAANTSLHKISTSNDTKPDTQNSSLSQLPTIPDHDPSIDSISETARKTKVKIAG